MKQIFGAALLLALPVLAADAADPGVAVPAPTYRSVFQDTPTGIEQEAIDWKKANAEVGQFPRGHIDLLKWEERQPAAAPARAPASAAGSKP